jgi:hypothetical protein
MAARAKKSVETQESVALWAAWMGVVALAQIDLALECARFALGSRPVGAARPIITMADGALLLAFERLGDCVELLRMASRPTRSRPDAASRPQLEMRRPALSSRDMARTSFPR